MLILADVPIEDPRRRLSRSKPPPGWRPAAQTRASPPHQPKNGLDGDPGVWAYVGRGRGGIVMLIRADV
jgi:hypothetical protein